MMAFIHESVRSVDARRFAALLAGFDTGNPSEEEAVAKARALRRMAVACGTRIIDALERADVRLAVDAQMQPKRLPGPELRSALEELSALRKELTERTRDVRRLAEFLKNERNAGRAHGTRSVATQVGGAREHSFGSQSWVFEILTILAAVALMVAAALN
jgi:hypothetical protein